MPADRELSDTERLNWLRQRAAATGDVTLCCNFELNRYWIEFVDEAAHRCRNFGNTLREAIDSAILNPGKEFTHGH